jgi:hypothetical protein
MSPSVRRSTIWHPILCAMAQNIGVDVLDLAYVHPWELDWPVHNWTPQDILTAVLQHSRMPRVDFSPMGMPLGDDARLTQRIH